MDLAELLDDYDYLNEPVVIVRVRTTSWISDNKINIKKELYPLRRQCEGFNFLEEDMAAIGDDVIKMITNLNDVKDGVYRIIYVNKRHDPETGIIDEWDYKLIKQEEKEPNKYV